MRTPRTSAPTIVPLTAVRSAKDSSALASAKASHRVVKASSAKGTVAKAKPTPMSGIVALTLVSSSALRELSASQSSDRPSRTAVSVGTRMDTIANEITDAEWSLVKARFAYMRELLRQVKGEGQKNEIEAMIVE